MVTEEEKAKLSEIFALPFHDCGTSLSLISSLIRILDGSVQKHFPGRGFKVALVYSPKEPREFEYAALGRPYLRLSLIGAI